MHNHCVHPPCTQAWMFCGGPLLTSATTTWPSSKWENTSIESTAKIKCCKRGGAGALCTKVRSIQISSSSVCTEVRSIQISSSSVCTEVRSIQISSSSVCTKVRSIQISSSSVCTEVRSIQISSSARNRKKEEEGQGFAGHSGDTRQWPECCLSLSYPGQNAGDKGEEVGLSDASLPISLMAWM
jgi:hypothetical protein